MRYVCGIWPWKEMAEMGGTMGSLLERLLHERFIGQSLADPNSLAYRRFARPDTTTIIDDNRDNKASTQSTELE